MTTPFNGAARVVLVLVPVLLVVAGGSPRASAGSRQSTKGDAVPTPDIVGFRAGMPLQEAYARLKSYDIRAAVRAGETEIAEFGPRRFPHVLQLSESGAASAEALQLDITMPPNPQVVWKVSRRLQFGAEKAASFQTLLAALREKYGPEFSLAPTSTVLHWFFDERGRRARDGADLSYRDCTGALSGFHPEIFVDVNVASVNPYSLPTTIPASHRPCQNTFVVVASFFFLPPDRELVTTMSVAVSNPALMRGAHQATYDAIAAVQAKQRQEQIEKGQQQRPKL